MMVPTQNLPTPKTFNLSMSFTILPFSAWSFQNVPLWLLQLAFSLFPAQTLN
jgi:hypothetical protein